MGRLSANPLDPEVYADLGRLGYYYAKAGVKTFADWAEKIGRAHV